MAGKNRSNDIMQPRSTVLVERKSTRKQTAKLRQGYVDGTASRFVTPAMQCPLAYADLKQPAFAEGKGGRTGYNDMVEQLDVEKTGGGGDFGGQFTVGGARLGRARRVVMH